ncbi:MAG: GntR family transcriptional regulator [Lachnospiraceae bacterium]|jgi:DNA-binding GntR family transcriptional regulator|nr:GntR family transcriptional regulator [Lachnospiraceae bacterium]
MPTKKLQVNTISRQVYTILKKSIVSGHYEPSQWLQEAQLSKELGVSRSPIREALKQLAADGLVKEIPNKGTFVREFSDKEMLEVYEIRGLLESYAISHLPEELSDEQKSKMENYKQRLREYYDDDDLEEYIVVDSKFHRYIIECTDNSILMELYRRVRNMNMLFRIYSLSSKARFDESIEEHTDLIDNIINGNYDEAVRINASHLSSAKETALAQLHKKKEG